MNVRHERPVRVQRFLCRRVAQCFLHDLDRDARAQMAHGPCIARRVQLDPYLKAQTVSDRIARVSRHLAVNRLPTTFALEFQRRVQRDDYVDAALRADGWLVSRLRESDVRNDLSAAVSSSRDVIPGRRCTNW